MLVVLVVFASGRVGKKSQSKNIDILPRHLFSIHLQCLLVTEGTSRPYFEKVGFMVALPDPLLGRINIIKYDM